MRKWYQEEITKPENEYNFKVCNHVCICFVTQFFCFFFFVSRVAFLQKSNETNKENTQMNAGLELQYMRFRLKQVFFCNEINWEKTVLFSLCFLSVSTLLHCISFISVEKLILVKSLKYKIYKKTIIKFVYFCFLYLQTSKISPDVILYSLFLITT